MSRISIKFDQAVIKNNNKKNRRKNEGKDDPGKMEEECLFASTLISICSYLVDSEKSSFWELLKTENIGQLLLSDQGNR